MELRSSSSQAATACPLVAGASNESPPRLGEIKRMWVDPAWRGAGLGSRLLRHLETEAIHLGYHTVRLDTNASLTDAIALYERAGYRHIARYNDNPYAQVWLEKGLTIDPV